MSAQGSAWDWLPFFQDLFSKVLEQCFNFSTWRDSDDGFDCGRDHQYLILCKHRWTRITSNLDYCSVQCAGGGKALLTAIVAVESITIVVLLLYIYRKPRIAEKERMDVQTLISRNFKHSSNHQLLVDNKIWNLLRNNILIILRVTFHFYVKIIHV